MTTCPYKFVGEHDARPDPEALGLQVGELRVCQWCRLTWRVAAVDPYVLEAELGAARLVLRALEEELDGFEQAQAEGVPDQQPEPDAGGPDQ